MRKLSQEEIGQLLTEAFEHVESDAYDQAHTIADQLMEAGVVEGYTLASTLHEAQEQFEEARTITRKGLEVFPGDWQLLVTMSGIETRDGNHAEALALADQAKQHPDAPKQLVELRRAITLANQGEFESALNTLQEIDDPEYIITALHLQMQILEELGRYDLIIQIAEEEEELIEVAESDEEAALLAEVHTIVGRAYWQQSDEDMALDHAHVAVDFDRTQPGALELIRQIKDEPSDSAKLFSLLIAGKMNEDLLEDGDTADFITSYLVLAETPDEALEYVKELDADIVEENSLNLMEFGTEEWDLSEDNLKGVVVAGDLGYLDISE